MSSVQSVRPSADTHASAPEAPKAPPLRKSRDGVSEGAYYARVLRGKGQRLRVYELDARRFAEARIEFREWLEDVDGSGWVELWDVDPCRHGDACKALERITVGGAS